VQIVGSTPHPDEAFMLQAMRHLTDDVDGVLHRRSVLICDRDRKWSSPVLAFLRSAGVHVVQTPVRAPNCNAHAERFVRSIKFECLHRTIPLGECHLRRAIGEYVTHYHHERNHQGLDNELIVGVGSTRGVGTSRRAQRLGGLLNFYHRAA
jgi:transposase InsO family protein